MPISKLVRANRWISPSVLLRAADLIGLPQESRCSQEFELQYTLKTVEIGGRTMPYAVYSPSNASDQSLPVILFLHGAGERGNDGRAQTKVGIAPALCRYSARYQAHVLMPQCPAGQQWSGPAERAAMLALEETIRATAADKARIYITGISMGAHGALRLAAQHPTRFAAVVAICGWADVRKTARRLKSVPVWLFHGTADPIVSARCSAELAVALKSAGACEVRHTEYTGVGHEIWDAAYADPLLPEWLFAHARS